MKFNHAVKYNGKFYPTGTDVPVGDKPKEETKKEEKANPTKTDINKMNIFDLKRLAISVGIEGANDMSGKELKPLVLEHFNL